MSAERVIQAALVAALRADAPYAALVTGVHDGDAAEREAMPYTVVGEMTEAIDRTHDLEGFQHTVTVHDWSEYEGRKQVQEIREARNAVLQSLTLAVSGWGLTKLVYEFGEVLVEWDADLKKHLRHQVTRYRLYSLESA